MHIVGRALMASSDHQTITSAGWSYRMNERGWVIYRDPHTGTWYTRSDAIAVLQAWRPHDNVAPAETRQVVELEVQPGFPR